MKHTLFGSTCAVALGLGISLAAPSLANAALTCTPGNIVGAGSCNESISFGPSPTELNNAILTIDKWISNASAGFIETLQDVVFTFSGSVNSSGTVTNNSTTQSETFSLSISDQFSFTPGAGAPANFLVPSIDANGSGGPPGFNLAPGGSSPYSITFAVGPAGSGTITTLLSQYTGPGTFQALASTLTGITVLGGGGQIGVTQSTLATAQIDVTYDFLTSIPGTETPLPAALPLFAGGLGVIGLLARRKSRKIKRV